MAYFRISKSAFVVKIKEITDYLESIAPIKLQESYDNSGLITGDKNWETRSVLITLDCTEEVIDEAILIGSNFIIAHHPIVFKGLKSLTGRNYVERTVLKAIKNDIAIYAIHTNLDNVINGVNGKIADLLHLTDRQVLVPKPGQKLKLVTFVPEEAVDQVLGAVHEAGAGVIGDYSECSFRTEGTGSFRPNDQAEPYSGKPGERSEASELRLEFILPVDKQAEVLQALIAVHPYDEVAYFLSKIENLDSTIGSGIIGKLATPLDEIDFLGHLKKELKLHTIRHSAFCDKPVSKIAICGGSGSFLLPHAIHQGADAFVTGDFKYHEFFDAEEKLMICDIGHYESEVYTKDLLYELLSKKFTNFAVNLSEIVTNPINYFN